MKKIKYFCPFSNYYFKGILVKEDSNFYYIADSLSFLWLESMGKLNVLENTTLRTYLKDSDFFYQEIPNVTHEYTKDELDFLFSLSIDDETLENIHFSSLFFEHFFSNRRKPFIERAECSLAAVEQNLPNKIISKLLNYVILHYCDDNNRIRMLFSPKIQKHLEGEST